MGKGLRECGPNQPCGCCGMSLQNGTIATSVVYLVDGIICLVVILFDIANLLKETKRTKLGLEDSAAYSILWAEILWVCVSIMLLVGALKRNRCLVLVFLIGIPISNLILFIASILLYLTLSPEENIDLFLVTFPAIVFFNVVSLCVKWYLYWVACAFYVELSRPPKAVNPTNDPPEEESPPPPYVKSSSQKSKRSRK